ncbi:FkbM family methyltransferase [Shimia sp. SDUM112013]|uniref:FkbM family methyltransferase n=1 Tax=Shimia sp. SDUM112013 TaxID=3136160 RepID=UPI0032EE0796
MIEFGEYSQQELDLLCRIAPRGGFVAEIGANIGVHTVPLAKHVGPSGFVHAVEPQPLVFQMLCGNLALNGLTNVDARNLGCGAKPGEVRFPDIDYSVPGNYGGIGLDQFKETDGRRSVQIQPFDTFGCTRLDLLKIDVEGMETDVLRGAENTIRACRPVLYVENDRPENSSVLIRYIQRQNYRIWWHLPPMFNPDNWKGHSDNPWSGLVSCNMLCIPRERPTMIKGLAEVTDPDQHPIRK